MQIFLVMHRKKISMFDPVFGRMETLAYPGKGQ